MTPDEDHLAIIGAKAFGSHFELCDAGDAWTDCQHCRDIHERVCMVLAAVLPAHKAMVRAKFAEEIDEQKTGCREHPMPIPDPSCWTCARDGAFHRAARIARGEA